MKLLKKQNIEYAQQLKDVMLHWNQLYELLLQEFKKFRTNNNIHIVGYKIELVDKLKKRESLYSSSYTTTFKSFTFKIGCQ